MKNKKEEPFQHEVVITDARLPLRLFYSNDQNRLMFCLIFMMILKSFTF